MNWKNAIMTLALILALGFLIWLVVEKSRYADLTRNFNRLRTSSSQASDQLERQNSRVSELERENRRLQDNRGSVDRELAAARQEAANLRRDISTLQSDASNAQSEKEELRQASDAAAQELAAANSRLAELEKRLAEMEDSSKPDTEYQALASAETEARSQIEALNADLSQVQGEKEQLRQASDAAAQELAAANSRLAELEKRLAEMETSSKPDTEYQALASAEAEARSQVEALSADLSQVQGEKEQLRQASEAAAQELAAANSRLAELEKRLAEVETSSKPDTEYQALVSAEAEARARLEDLNSRLEQALAEIERLKKELDARPLSAPPVDPAEDRDGLGSGLQPEIESLRRELESSRQALLELGISSRTARVRTAAELKNAQIATTRLNDEMARTAEAEREARTLLADCRQNLTGHQARAEKLEAETDRLQAEKRALKNSLAAVFVDQLLFDSGSVALSPAGRQVLDAAARVVNQSPERAVLVVGHSDDEPPNRRLSRYYPSNWELSAARAASVIRYLTEQGGVDPVRMALVGRSQHQPEVPNETDENRRINRRVEIIISDHLPPGTAAP